MVEIERPTRLPLTDPAIPQTAYLDDAAWTELLEARRSPLFHRPIDHFAIRAFASDGIDEFLAHVTVIEAALGQPIDHDPRKRPKINGNGARARPPGSHGAWRRSWTMPLPASDTSRSSRREATSSMARRCRTYQAKCDWTLDGLRVDACVP